MFWNIEIHVLYHIKIITSLIPEYTREGMPIKFQDSADLKDSLQLHVLTKGFYVATIPISGIPYVGNTTMEQATTPRNILYLYRFSE